jgi:hypothetical protein
MNLRHAAALALVLWYLMAPPSIGADSKTYAPDTNAPLTLWTVVASFSSQQDGEKAKKEMQPKANNRLDPSSTYAQTLPYYRCESSDNSLAK